MSRAFLKGRLEDLAYAATPIPDPVAQSKMEHLGSHAYDFLINWGVYGADTAQGVVKMPQLKFTGTRLV
jgi:hypothetical protein